MGLLNDIKTILSNLYPDSLVIFSSTFQANVQTYLTDPDQLPIIIISNDLPKTDTIQINNNVIKDIKILISFLSLDSTDNTDDQSEVLRQDMEDMADMAAVKIYQLTEVRPSNRQQYKVTPMFHVFSSNMTGVALEMQVNYNSIITF